VVETTPPNVDMAGTELPIDKYSFNNIVFLIDVSSSMSMSDRLPLLKKSMATLINQLRPVDRVSIITYASNASVLYPSKPVTSKEELILLIESLSAGGSTSADKGLKLSYDVMVENYITNGNNQLIIATDGAFTLKEKDLNLFNGGAANNQPIKVSIIGFGKNKDAQKGLRQMAKQFKGSYIYIANSNDAERALLDEIKKNSRK
jgi:Ca-activated chloride channel family protein